MLLSLEPRGRQSRWMLLASPLLAGLLALVCGALRFAWLGHDPWQTLHTVLVQPLSDLYGLGELLVKAMPILLCALGLALAGVWALLLGWGIGLGSDNFAMYFGWTALLMTILLVALFLGATLLRM